MVAAQADPAQKNLVMGFYNATKSLGSILGSLMAGFAYTVHAKLPFVIVVAAYAMGIAAAVGYLALGRKQLTGSSAQREHGLSAACLCCCGAVQSSRQSRTNGFVLEQRISGVRIDHQADGASGVFGCGKD